VKARLRVVSLWSPARSLTPASDTCLRRGEARSGPEARPGP
jgi:hypothetical protein